MTEQAGLLSVRGLGKKFGGFKALNGFDLDIAVGERIGDPGCLGGVVRLEADVHDVGQACATNAQAAQNGVNDALFFFLSFNLAETPTCGVGSGCAKQ